MLLPLLILLPVGFAATNIYRTASADPSVEPSSMTITSRSTTSRCRTSERNAETT